MVDKTGIQFEIDAKNAEAGAKRVDSAIRKINTSMDSVVAKTNKVRAELNKPFSSKGFAAIAQQVGLVNKLRVDGALISSMKSLSSVMGNIKGPSATVIKNIDLLNNSIRGFSGGNIAKITSMAIALGAFKGPPPSAATRIQALFQALAGLKVPPNTAAIVAALNSIATAAQGAGVSMRTLNSTKLNLGGITNSIGGANSALGGFTGGLGIAQGAIASLQAAAASFILTGLVTEAFRVSAAFIGIEQGFKAINKGNMALATADMQVAARVATKYGLDLEATSRSYMKLSAATKSAGFETKAVEKLFGQVSGTAAVLGLSNSQVELTYLALTQMISKGTVSMEELRQQLGEQIPGAVNLFAESMGLSVKEFTALVEAGGVAGSAVLKFGDQLEKVYSGGFTEASNRATAALGRLQIVFTKLYQTVGDEFLDGSGKAIDNIVKSMTKMENGGLVLNDKFKQIAKDIGQGFLTLVETIASVAKYLIENFDQVITAAKLIGVYLSASILSGIATGMMSIAGSVMAVVRGIQIVAGFAVALSPWTVAIAAVVAGLVILYNYLGGFAGISTIFSDLWESIKSGASSMYESVTGFFGSLYEMIAGYVTGLGELWYGLGEIILGALTFDMALIQSGFETVTQGYATMFESIGLGATTAATGISEKMSTASESIKVSVSSAGTVSQAKLQEVAATAGVSASVMAESFAKAGVKIQEDAVTTYEGVTLAMNESADKQKEIMATILADTKQNNVNIYNDYVDVNGKVIVSAQAMGDKMEGIFKGISDASTLMTDKIGENTNRIGGFFDGLGLVLERIKGGLQQVGAEAAKAGAAISALESRAASNAKNMYNIPGTDDKGNYKESADQKNARMATDTQARQNAINAERATRDRGGSAPLAPYRNGFGSSGTNGYYTNVGTGSNVNTGVGGTMGGGPGSSITGGTGNSAGSITNAGGGKFAGGPVSQDINYLTGERGPELYVPNGKGSPRLLGQAGPEYFTPPDNGEILNSTKTNKLIMEENDSYKVIPTGGNNDVVKPKEKTVLSGGAVNDESMTSVNGFNAGSMFQGESKTITRNKSPEEIQAYYTANQLKAYEQLKIDYAKVWKIAQNTDDNVILNAHPLVTSYKTQNFTGKSIRKDYSFTSAYGKNFAEYQKIMADGGPWSNVYQDSISNADKIASRMDDTRRRIEQSRHDTNPFRNNFKTGGYAGIGGGFSTGGSFEVPANGSGDSTMANLMLSGGERVDITPKRDVQHTRQYPTGSEEGNGGGNKTVIINVEIKTPDPDAFRASERQMKARLARALSDI